MGPLGTMWTQPAVMRNTACALRPDKLHLSLPLLFLQVHLLLQVHKTKAAHITNEPHQRPHTCAEFEVCDPALYCLCIYKWNFRLVISISLRLCIHSYSPNWVSKIPSWIQRNFKVKRGPNSCKRVLTWGMGLVLSNCLAASIRFLSSTASKIYRWCLTNR